MARSSRERNNHNQRKPGSGALGALEEAIPLSCLCFISLSVGKQRWDFYIIKRRYSKAPGSDSY